MFSPFRNGILRRRDGSTKHRSLSEKGDSRTTSNEDVALVSSSPALEDYNHERQNDDTEPAAQDGDQVEIRDSIYSPPSVLDEDEDDPHSHAAMTRRAEEILANAKKRLTVSACED